MDIASLRKDFLQRVCKEVLSVNRQGIPNWCDKDNKSSVSIGRGIADRMPAAPGAPEISGQEAGSRFQRLVHDFLQTAFQQLVRIRPGSWEFCVGISITQYYQYEHLAILDSLSKQQPTLKTALGTDYLVTPDVIVARRSEDDSLLDPDGILFCEEAIATQTPLRKANYDGLILHAVISCEWTIRSDRAQNTRTEALNIIRNRKGHTPHICAVVAEPLPTRIASLALGTGDIDCVYHVALPELREAIQSVRNDDQLDMLQTLVDGRRLRDISDLPFDLAI